jgi:hypothetical protein
MPPLPRGTCPICFADVALRKGDLVREHRNRYSPAGPVCSGSARRALISNQEILDALDAQRKEAARDDG